MRISLALTREQHSMFGATPTGELVEVGRVGPRCDVRAYAVQMNRYDVVILATPTLEAFTDPWVRYEANGQQLAPWFRLADWTTLPAWPGSYDAIQTLVNRPTMYRQAVLESRWTDVFWQVGDNPKLHLQPRHWGDDIGGRFEVEIRVLASEGRGDDASAVEATAKISVTTAEIVLPERAHVEQAECVVSRLDAWRFEWPPPLEHPDWRLPAEFDDLMRTHDLEAGGEPLLRLLEQARSGVSSAIRRLSETAVLLDVTPAALVEVGRRFELRALERERGGRT